MPKWRIFTKSGHTEQYQRLLRTCYLMPAQVKERKKIFVSKKEKKLLQLKWSIGREVGCDCGSVGRPVDFDTKGLWFESSHRQSNLDIDYLKDGNLKERVRERAIFSK